ncbi:MAG: transporter substrate-binding domain-containing protein [Pseudomonadota bacterium]
MNIFLKPGLIKPFTVMRFFKQHLVLAALFIIASTVNTTAQGAETIEVLTEATPFTVIRPDEAHTGEATIFVKNVLARANIESEIQYTPWKRSYQYALTQPNVLIYPIARTNEREEQFEWIGSIIPVSYFLFKLKARDDIALEEIYDAKQYTIGVVNKHAHHEYLSGKGFDNFQAVNNSEQNLRKLLLGRIDLFPLSSGGLFPLCRQVQIDCSQIVPVMALEDFSDGLYMAFSKNSDSAAIEQIKQAYKEERNTPGYERLFANRNIQAKRIETIMQPSSTVPTRSSGNDPQ